MTAVVSCDKIEKSVEEKAPSILLDSPFESYLETRVAASVKMIRFSYSNKDIKDEEDEEGPRRHIDWMQPHRCRVYLAIACG